MTSANREKDRLIDITADGVISDDGLVDFARIQNQPRKISRTVETLQLWIENMTATGGIDKEQLERIRESLTE